MKKKVCFLTGTRADFGKLKPLMRRVADSQDFECTIFATGMHLLPRHGYTVQEIYKSGFTNVHTFNNQAENDTLELVLANTLRGLSAYLREARPDLVIVHGDRVETLAGAIAGLLQNILVGHIEGGEISGTVDEILRHAVTKLCHLHFVANRKAAARLRQLGEEPKNIYCIGSPEIDVMLSKDLPNLETVRSYYEIPFATYAVAVFHPVTTELSRQREYAEEFVEALLTSGDCYVVIYPNNDPGAREIYEAYERLKPCDRVKILPSMRFEYYLSLMRSARYLIGNSSSGVREAPVYGIPAINVTSRQRNRHHHATILNVACRAQDMLSAIRQVDAIPPDPSRHFGDGQSAERFMKILRGKHFWHTPIQKQFLDITPLHDEILDPIA